MHVYIHRHTHSRMYFCPLHPLQSENQTVYGKVWYIRMKHPRKALVDTSFFWCPMRTPLTPAKHMYTYIFEFSWTPAPRLCKTSVLFLLLQSEHHCQTLVCHFCFCSVSQAEHPCIVKHVYALSPCATGSKTNTRVKHMYVPFPCAHVPR